MVMWFRPTSATISLLATAHSCNYARGCQSKNLKIRIVQQYILVLILLQLTLQVPPRELEDKGNVFAG